jgi:hypothetical protein
VTAGTGITVSGSGTAQDPFVLSADTHIAALDNARFNVTVAGLGTAAAPYTVAVDYAATSKLANIPDVNAPAPTNGQVLSFNTATLKWVPAAPTTAAAGSVNHNQSLTGDGSVGTPLAVVMAAARFLALDGANGIGLSDLGINQLVRHFATAAARLAALPAPVLNTLSMLDTSPGVISYWDGAQWVTPTPVTVETWGAAFLEVSGPYNGVSQRTRLVNHISGTTDALGVMDIVPAASLATAGGVLACTFQETGTNAFKAVLFPNVNKVSARIYRLTDGTLWASQTFSGIADATIY